MCFGLFPPLLSRAETDLHYFWCRRSGTLKMFRVGRSGRNCMNKKKHPTWRALICDVGPRSPGGPTFTFPSDFSLFFCCFFYLGKCNPGSKTSLLTFKLSGVTPLLLLPLLHWQAVCFVCGDVLVSVQSFRIFLCFLPLSFFSFSSFFF